MPYVITDRCTLDGACVEVCPVACIHTTPDAPQFYIDPDICIECEQCLLVCPVEAIFIDTELPAEYLRFAEVNAAFFRQNKAVVGPVELDAALAMVRAAHAYADQLGVAVAVAVVDNTGAPIAVGRMDGATPRTAELALHKAYTTATFQMASDELVPEARAPWLRSLVVGSRGRIVAASGGVSILIDGVTVVGAIGVAGGRNAEQDVLCCRAGLAALLTAAH